jgi:hypothetical protein
MFSPKMQSVEDIETTTTPESPKNSKRKRIAICCCKTEGKTDRFCRVHIGSGICEHDRHRNQCNRFNPDAYTDQHGNRVTSCWTQNKKGLMAIKPSKKVEWETRIETLKQEILHFIDNPSQKTVEVIRLFY